MFDMVDDQDIARGGRRYEFKAQLLLQGFKFAKPERSAPPTPWEALRVPLDASIRDVQIGKTTLDAELFKGMVNDKLKVRHARNSPRRRQQARKLSLSAMFRGHGVRSRNGRSEMPLLRERRSSAGIEGIRRAPI